MTSKDDSAHRNYQKKPLIMEDFTVVGVKQFLDTYTQAHNSAAKNYVSSAEKMSDWLRVNAWSKLIGRKMYKFLSTHTEVLSYIHHVSLEDRVNLDMQPHIEKYLNLIAAKLDGNKSTNVDRCKKELAGPKMKFDFNNLMTISLQFQRAVFTAKEIATTNGCSDYCLDNDAGRKMLGVAVIQSIKDEEVRKYVTNEIAKKSEPFFRALIELAVCKNTPPGLLGDIGAEIVEPMTMLNAAIETTTRVESLDDLQALHDDLVTKLGNLTSKRERETKDSIVKELAKLWKATRTRLLKQKSKLLAAKDALELLKDACDNKDATLPSKWQLRRQNIGSEYFGSDNSVIAWDPNRGELIRGSVEYWSNLNALQTFVVQCIKDKLKTMNPKMGKDVAKKLRRANVKVTEYADNVLRLTEENSELKKQIRFLSNKKNDDTRKGEQKKKKGLFSKRNTPPSTSASITYACYNCGSEKHRIFECPDERDEERIRLAKDKAEDSRRRLRNKKARTRQAKKARESSAKRKREEDSESDSEGREYKRPIKRVKIMTPTLSAEVTDHVENALKSTKRVKNPTMKRRITRLRAKRNVRAVGRASRLMESFVDAVADRLVSEGMAEAKAEADAEKAMSDWMTGAMIAMLHSKPTVNSLKSTSKHPIICPSGLQEPGWRVEVARLDGHSVGAFGSMCADTGAQFCCIPSSMGAQLVASGFKMFKASDGVIAQVSTDVEVEGIVYGDLVLHSPSGGTVVFKRMQCVVLPGDEVLLSNWCLDQLGLKTYDVLNAAADKAVVIEGNVQSQDLIDDVEASDASIRRLHGDAGANVIHYFDPRSHIDETSFSAESDTKVGYSSVKHKMLQSEKTQNVVDNSNPRVSIVSDRSNAPRAKTKGTRLTRIRTVRKRTRLIRQLDDFTDSMDREDIKEIQNDIDNIMLASFYTFVDSLPIPKRDKQRHKDRMQDVVYSHENIFRVKALMEEGADIDPYKPSMKPDHIPVVCKRPNFSAEQTEAADKMVNKMVAAGYWSVTHNAIYASPLMMVPKPSSTDNPWRPTINMQRVNSLIQASVWPFPDLKRSFMHISKNKSKYFGTADLDGAFQQILIHKDFRHIFAVMTDKGVFEPSRILQGSVDSPAYFQGQVAEKLGDMLGPKILQWLDDLINHASSIDELIDNWEELFGICKRYNFKLSVKKMVLGGEQVKYCGYLIDADGYQYEPSSYQSLLEMKTPRNAQELSQLVNCTNWMRTAIPLYAELVKPLRVVLENVYKEKGNRTKYGLMRYKVGRFGWNESCDESYRLIKQAIVHRMKLYFPSADGSDQLCVITDASETGWCGVVTAVEDWKDGVEVQDQIHKPVGFTSGIFTGAEINWGIQSKEAFAMWQTVTKMQHVTRSMPFKIFTDNKNVSHLFQRGRLWPDSDLPKVTARRLLGWAEEMANFEYTLEHIDGDVMEEHLLADMVSRWANPHQHRVASEQAAVRSVRKKKVRAVRFDSFLNYGHHTKIDAFEWPSITSIKASQKKFRRRATIDLHRVRSDGLLSPVGKTTIWIPSEDKHLQVSLCVIAHCSLSGHRGLETTTKNLEDYFWTTMKEDLKTFTKQCLQCEQVKGKRTVPRPYGNVVKGTKRNECITFDYLHVEKPGESSPHQYKYILVIKDTYSHFTLLYPCESADAHTAATALSHWVGIFGVPQILLSDRGSHFKNSTIEELARLIGVDKHHFTLPHTPWSNGSVERVNLEILNLLAMLIGEQGVLTWEWPYYINGIIDILNSTPSRTLDGLAPREVMMELPRTNLANMLVKIPDITEVKSVDLTGANIKEQVQITSDALRDMHYRVDLAAEKRRKKNRKQRLKKWKAVRGNFDIGCYVMHARVKTTSESKLSFHWHGPYRVIGLQSDQVIDIEHLVTGQQRSVHTTRVKYYSGPDMEIPEALLESITYQDSVRYKVQHILAVRLNPVSTTYEFFVKWKGFDDAENSWEPLSTLQVDVPTLLVEFVKTMKPSNHKSILTDAVAQ